MSSTSPLVSIALILGILTSVTQGVSVGDVFDIKSGTTKGGCDGKNIDGWFADTVTLANSASTGAAATDQDSRKYLKTFFSIGPQDDATQAGEQKWDDVAFDDVTGLPRVDGKKVQDVFPKDTTGLVPFWSDDLRQYLKADSGDYCSDSENLAATQDQTAPSTITLCIGNFLGTQGDTLANVPSVTKEKVSVSTLQVHSLTLFHEMFHLVLGTKATPDHSYNLNSIVRFGTTKAIQNPESYTFYALAYFLGQNTQFTFANSKSANRPPPANPKRSAGDYVSMLARFQLYKQDLPQGVWVA
ncbi:hypothetical protein F5B22DRAFT_647271 [Xylaria bambusicola]|uniref:uncharacterized protein n=1 Tax=Xylaria bambusicola TaxID=326684 RepID=UPI00200866C9|nr:uncharacterized protein F5B22DRAFT_647271 [Xylaria bambusicola]KAI0514792.1 hypothetical protein F5B22DRAFT_647271 [Xylaria bambusicola]